jgi:hypothetical protein
MLVKAQDRERAHGRLGEQDTGYVDRIKRSNRFTRKRAASALDDFIFKPQKIPVGSNRFEKRLPIRSIRFRHVTGGYRSDQNPVALNQG